MATVVVGAYSTRSWTRPSPSSSAPTTLPVGLGGEHQLQRNDRVLCYTDGVIEERDVEGEPFGEERLIRCVNRIEHAEEGMWAEALLLSRTLKQERDGRTGDDATLFLIEWRGATGHSPSWTDASTLRCLVVWPGAGPAGPLCPRVGVQYAPGSPARYSWPGWPGCAAVSVIGPDRPRAVGASARPAPVRAGSAPVTGWQAVRSRVCR